MHSWILCWSWSQGLHVTQLIKQYTMTMSRFHAPSFLDLSHTSMVSWYWSGQGHYSLCVSLVAICVVCGVKNPEIAFCTSTRGTLRYSDSDFLFLCLWGLLYVGSIWDLIPVLDTVHWHAPFDTSQISFFYDSSAHPLPLML
jgi:hypothetical protein